MEDIKKIVKEVVEEVLAKSIEKIVEPKIKDEKPEIGGKTINKFTTIAITCLAVIKFKNLLIRKSIYYEPPSPRFPPSWCVQRQQEIERNIEDELYLKEDDIADEIIIKVPEKYVNEYVITLRENVNLLTNFLYQMKNIREQNFSLREVTLNKLMILHIEREIGDNIDLFLNLGLNPYIDFNDYYIKEFNSVNIKYPILVFKRYVKFDPYNINNLYINKPMNLTIRFRDITIKGQNIMKHYCSNSLPLRNVESKIIISNFYLEDIINEKDIWTVEKYKFNLKLTKKYAYDRNLIIIGENFNNLEIWRHGESILTGKKAKYYSHMIDPNPSPREFKWFRKVTIKEYELVKSYKKITDFEQIMVDEEFYEEIEPILTLYDNVDRDERREYYKTFNDIGYHDKREKFMNKMKMLAGTSICNGDDFTYDKELELLIQENMKEGLKIKTKKSRLTRILLNYIADVQEYIFEGDDKKIRRYIKKEDLFDTIYDNEKLYEELLNENLFKLIEEGLEKYEEEIINNEQFELQTPDIYILLGFHEFPSKFSREFWDVCEFSKTYKWMWIIKSQSFLESTGWYYMYGLCCFFAQLIGPSYYLYNYYLIDKNEYCPNNSLTLNKFFAVAYYLVLYARMNSFWNSLTTTAWQYGNTTLIQNDNYLRMTLIINSICLCIIPLFTYTLFIEMSSITDLILNCLTGEFLINIDNLIVEFIGEENYIKSITKDLLILSFIEKGFPKKNIMEGDTIELWIMSALQILQMFGTLLITVFVYRCI
tara:strand:+ start:9108 stop:11405 length:2298 start_codon:yes stop_codon:yes gene_type:complete